MGYTELELKVIGTFGSFMNYDTLEDNLSDNCTCVDAKAVAKLTGLDIKQVKGVLSSLEQKGLVVIDITNINQRTLMVTNQGVIEYFKLKEANSMVKVIEKATGTQFKAKAIEGGFEVYTLSGEKYKKLKESTFRRYFKTAAKSAKSEVEPEETKEQAVEPEKTEGEPTPEPEKKQEKAPKKEKKSEPKQEPKIELEGVNRENMVEKIKKMLNLSENNPSEEEAKSAVLMAQRLMAKYGIHEDEVTLEEVRDEIGATAARLKHDSSLHSWRKGLALVVAKNFRVKAYMDGKKDMVFRGYKEDVKIAVEVFLYLYSLGNTLGSKMYHEKLAETGSGKGVYNSFVLGFVEGVESVLNEQCTALMIVTPKEVEEEYAEFSKNFKHSKYTAKGNFDEAYMAGHAEGKAAMKSRQLNDKGSKKTK